MSGSDEKPPTTLPAEQRPGKNYGVESYRADANVLPPEVEGSQAFKRAKQSCGPSAHEVQWGPDAFGVYTDLNNPFYYRTPKGMTETPAHVPQNPVCLEMHLRDERQRLAGMSKAEREWRQKYLDDQTLHTDEPFFIQDAQMPLNPWRVLYRRPWDTLARKFLYPTFGIRRGHKIRQSVPKFMLAFIGFEFVFYYIKYCHETWKDAQRVATLTLNPQIANRDMIEDKYPGLIEKAYPVFKVGSDFYDIGFKERTYFRDLGPTQRPW